jgi:CBS domain-containing protein
MPLDRLVHDEILGTGHRCFLVTDDGHLEGLLTLHEVKGVPRDRWREVTTARAMTPAEKLTTVGPGESLLVAIDKMDADGLAQLPVVEGETLVGLISREHVLRYVSARAELGI